MCLDLDYYNMVCTENATGRIAVNNIVVDHWVRYSDWVTFCVFDFWTGRMFSLFIKTCRPAMRHTHARTEWVPEEVFPCCKGNGSRIYHSFAPNTAFKNAWDYTCIPHCILGWLLIKHTDNFYIYNSLNFPCGQMITEGQNERNEKRLEVGISPERQVSLFIRGTKLFTRFRKDIEV